MVPLVAFQEERSNAIEHEKYYRIAQHVLDEAIYLTVSYGSLLQLPSLFCSLAKLAGSLDDPKVMESLGRAGGPVLSPNHGFKNANSSMPVLLSALSLLPLS